MKKWPNEVPPDLRYRLESVLSFRSFGPADVWGVVREWLEAQEVEQEKAAPQLEESRKG